MLVDIELRLLYNDQKRSVNLPLVASLKTFKEALLLCKSLSMLNDADIAERMDMGLADFVSIWSGEAFFPMEKLLDYMGICENIIPTLWLALKCGYKLAPLEDELAQEARLLEERIEERKQEMKILKDQIFGGLAERLAANDSEEYRKVAQLVNELKEELSRQSEKKTDEQKDRKCI